jgi:hypothetical protein
MDCSCCAAVGCCGGCPRGGAGARGPAAAAADNARRALRPPAAGSTPSPLPAPGAPWSAACAEPHAPPRACGGYAAAEAPAALALTHRPPGAVAGGGTPLPLPLPLPSVLPLFGAESRPGARLKTPPTIFLMRSPPAAASAAALNESPVSPDAEPDAGRLGPAELGTPLPAVRGEVGVQAEHAWVAHGAGHAACRALHAC